jgi:hypothetical protein
MHAQWLDFLTQRGAVVAPDQVMHFGQPGEELQAATQGTIIADLSHLGLLQVDGADAVTFLQGQLTNDIKLLDGSNSQYAGYCTAKGRLLAIFLAFAHHDHLYLQLNRTLKESIAKRLKMYVLRSKVILTDVSDTIIRFGIAGPQAASALTALFGEVPDTPMQRLDLERANLIRLPGDTPRYEIFSRIEEAPAIWSQLQLQCVPVGKSVWDWLDIQAGIPDVTPATSEAFVPQMLNLDKLGGISFKKGCYTGQEIVARTHYLGKVKRRTYLAHVTTDQSPQPGEPLFGNDTPEPIGQLVSTAASPHGGYDVLAELRSENTTAGGLHWASTDGPLLELKRQPYAVE